MFFVHVEVNETILEGYPLDFLCTWNIITIGTDISCLNSPIILIYSYKSSGNWQSIRASEKPCWVKAQFSARQGWSGSWCHMLMLYQMWLSMSIISHLSFPHHSSFFKPFILGKEIKKQLLLSLFKGNIFLVNQPNSSFPSKFQQNNDQYPKLRISESGVERNREDLKSDRARVRNKESFHKVRWLISVQRCSKVQIGSRNWLNLTTTKVTIETFSDVKKTTPSWFARNLIFLLQKLLPHNHLNIHFAYLVFCTQLLRFIFMVCSCSFAAVKPCFKHRFVPPLICHLMDIIILKFQTTASK